MIPSITSPRTSVTPGVAGALEVRGHRRSLRAATQEMDDRPRIVSSHALRPFLARRLSGRGIRTSTPLARLTGTGVVATRPPRGTTPPPTDSSAAADTADLP